MKKQKGTHITHTITLYKKANWPRFHEKTNQLANKHNPTIHIIANTTNMIHLKHAETLHTKQTHIQSLPKRSRINIFTKSWWSEKLCKTQKGMDTRYNRIGRAASYRRVGVAAEYLKRENKQSQNQTDKIHPNPMLPKVLNTTEVGQNCIAYNSKYSNEKYVNKYIDIYYGITYKV